MPQEEQDQPAQFSQHLLPIHDHSEDLRVSQLIANSGRQFQLSTVSHQDARVFLSQFKPGDISLEEFEERTATVVQQVFSDKKVVKKLRNWVRQRFGDCTGKRLSIDRYQFETKTLGLHGALLKEGARLALLQQEKRLKQGNERILKQFQHLKEDFDQRQAELKALEEQLALREKELAKGLKKFRSTVQEQGGKMLKKLEQLGADGSALIEARAAQAEKKLRARIRTELTARQQKLRKSEMVEKKKNELAERGEKLEEQLAEAKRKLSAAESQLQKQRAELQDCLRSNQALRQDCKRAKGRAAESDKQKTELEAQLKKTEPFREECQRLRKQLQRERGKQETRVVVVEQTERQERKAKSVPGIGNFVAELIKGVEAGLPGYISQMAQSKQRRVDWGQILYSNGARIIPCLLAVAKKIEAPFRLLAELLLHALSTSKDFEGQVVLFPAEPRRKLAPQKGIVVFQDKQANSQVVSCVQEEVKGSQTQDVHLWILLLMLGAERGQILRACSRLFQAFREQLEGARPTLSKKQVCLLLLLRLSHFTEDSEIAVSITNSLLLLTIQNNADETAPLSSEFGLATVAQGLRGASPELQENAVVLLQRAVSAREPPRQARKQLFRSLSEEVGGRAGTDSFFGKNCRALLQLLGRQ